MSPEPAAGPGPDDDRRFFFVHVQKAAGTSLLRRFRRVFTEEQIYPDDSDGHQHTVAPQIMPEQLVARWAVRGDRIRLVTGHLPLCTTELVDVPFTTLTVVREPVERTLSYLRHHRWFHPEDADRPLEEIYEDPFRYHGMIHNHMVKLFGMTVEEMTSGMLTHIEFTPEHLARAKAGLASVDVVGLQDDFEGFCRELEDRFGWDLGKPVRANTTEPADIPASLVERIAADNALDAELYRFAVDLVADRAAATTRAPR